MLAHMSSLPHCCWFSVTRLAFAIEPERVELRESTAVARAEP